MGWFEKKEKPVEDRRVGDRRSQNIIVRSIVAVCRFVCITIPLAVLSFFKRLIKWALIFLGTLAVLGACGVFAVVFSPEIIDFADQKYADTLTERLEIKDVAPLYSEYYFHEETDVYVAGNKKVSCFSSPEHRQIIDKVADVALFEQAILASEDKSFYDHNGVDGSAILRAAFGQTQHALGLGGSKSGASTISMQLAKSLYKDENGKDAPRTIRQKLREAVTAIRVERVLNKHQIMQRYINMPYLGRGTYGVESASRAYFGKSAKELSLPEVAFIVALINKPALPDRTTKGDPHPDETKQSNFREAIRGAQRVLDLMYDARETTGITKVAYAQASIDLEKLKVFPVGSGCSANDSGKYYTERVRVEYKDKIPLNSGGYDVFLPRDDGLQDALAKALAMTVETYLLRHPNDPDNAELRACAYAIQFNGDVLAWVGNVDYKKYKFDACALGWRSPGSTIKPFTYAALVQKLVNDVLAEPNPPATIDAVVSRVLAKCNVLDAPIAVGLGRGRGKKWIQNFHSNSEPLYRGNIACALALGESRNAAAMRAGQQGGIKEMIKLIYLLGMPKDAKHIQQPYPTTAIGGSDVRPIGMAGVATFLNGGFKVSPRFATDVCKDGKSTIFVEDDGRPRDCDMRSERREVPERLIHPAVSATMTELLKGPVDLATGTVHGLRTGVVPGMDPLSSEIWKMKKEEREKRMIAFPIETSGEIAGKTGTATNADGRTSDVWLLLFVPGPDGAPEKGIMLVFWMGKDSKDHPLGERGTKGGGGFAESGGRNWTHSAATVLRFLQKERGYLKEGFRFRPMVEDDVLLNFGVKDVTVPEGTEPADPEQGIIDPSDPSTPPELLKGLPPEEPEDPETKASAPEGDGAVKPSAPHD